MISWRQILLVGLMLSQPVVARAQSVQQSGPVTPGHAAMWVTSGVVKDAGPATAGNLTELGITRNGGLPLCINTGPISAPYQQMCLSVSTAGGGRIDLNGFNGASQLPFTIAISGVPVFISGVTPSQVPTVTRVTSGVTNSATALFDQTIAWASSTSGTKTQTIPTCTAAIVGFKISVKDEIRTASAAAPIRITPSGNTIENLASYPMPWPGGGVTVQCDGNANWMLL